jgi:quinol monooxygenase YgiN
MELTIEMRVRPGKFQELYQTLQALLPTIRKEKGCRDCRISWEVEDGEILFLSVHWEAPASLEHYMQSVSGIALVGAIDVLSETAKVKFGQNGPWEGVDALKRIRKTPYPFANSAAQDEKER